MLGVRSSNRGTFASTELLYVLAYLPCVCECFLSIQPLGLAYWFAPTLCAAA